MSFEIENEINDLENKKKELISQKQDLSNKILLTKNNIEQLSNSLLNFQQTTSIYKIDQEEKLLSLNQQKNNLTNANKKKSKLIRTTFFFITKLFLILLLISIILKKMLKIDFILTLVDFFILTMIFFFCLFIIKIGYSIIIKNKIKHLDAEIRNLQNVDLLKNNEEIQKIEIDKNKVQIILENYENELEEINIQLSEIEKKINSFTQFQDCINNFNSNYNSIDNNSILNYIYINNNNNDYESEHLSVKKLYTQLSRYSNSYSNNKILSETEIQFYKKLLAITDEKRTLIQFKVRLSDIIQIGSFVNKDYNNQWKEERKREYLNAINNKHIDFVLLDKNTLQIKLCIELDDASHYDYNDKYFDRKHINSHITKDILLSYCKIPFFRFDSSQILTMNNDTLLKHLYDAINQSSVYYDYTIVHKKLFEASLNKLSQE